MHGQKKRRKRTLDGRLEIEGTIIFWHLANEPLWSTEHGFKGLSIAVESEGGNKRKLILEYPYPRDAFGSPLPLPQRPDVSVKKIEAAVRQAVVAGWEPNSRGKAFIHNVTED